VQGDLHFGKLHCLASSQEQSIGVASQRKALSSLGKSYAAHVSFVNQCQLLDEAKGAEPSVLLSSASEDECVM